MDLELLPENRDRVDTPVQYDAAEQTINPHFVRSIMDVLAEKTGSDWNMNDAGYWTRTLDANDFFKDLNETEMRQILSLIANAHGAAHHNVHNRLVDVIGEIATEDV